MGQLMDRVDVFSPRAKVARVWFMRKRLREIWQPSPGLYIEGQVLRVLARFVNNTKVIYLLLPYLNLSSSCASRIRHFPSNHRAIDVFDLLGLRRSRWAPVGPNEVGQCRVPEG
jgi:hypothetical protein